MNLSDHIKVLTILNLDKAESQTVDEFKSQQTVSQSKYITSDADEELLILVKFEAIINLQSIKLHALSTTHSQLVDNEINVSAPKLIYIYKTPNINIDFNDISNMKSDVTIQCRSIKKLNNGQIINLQKQSKNVIKFKKVQHLAIYIKTNHNDTELTYLNHITFIGTEINKQAPQPVTETNKRLNELNKAFKNDVQYELDSSYLLQNIPQNDTKAVQQTEVNQNSCILDQCKHLKQIHNVLKTYHQYGVSQHTDITDVLNQEYNEIQLLNDFNHLLFTHDHQFED
eukprot:316853_1